MNKKYFILFIAAFILIILVLFILILLPLSSNLINPISVSEECCRNYAKLNDSSMLVNTTKDREVAMIEVPYAKGCVEMVSTLNDDVQRQLVYSKTGTSINEFIRNLFNHETLGVIYSEAYADDDSIRIVTKNIAKC